MKKKIITQRPHKERKDLQLEGEIFEAEVRDLSSDGRAIVSHPSGRTVFVPGAWPGEKVRAKITSTKGRVAFAQLEELLSVHPQRTTAPCPHHGFQSGNCGACPWQFMNYEAQLDAKQKRVEDVFARIAPKLVVNKIHASDKQAGYRNRAQFKSDGRALGFVSPQTRDFAPVESCLVLSEKNQETFSALKNSLPNSQWQPKKKQEWVTLDIDEDIGPGEVSVNQRRPFKQANDDQNNFMREWLKQKLSGLSVESPVIELFSGSGNFTQVISELGFKSITAAEVADNALQALSEVLPKVETVQAELYTESGLNKVLAKNRNAEILVLDPPRDGLKVYGNLFSKRSKIKRIFYVSCDLATLARDVKYCLDHGFKLREVQPLDMFPHTPHIECMLALSKKS